MRKVNLLFFVLLSIFLFSQIKDTASNINEISSKNEKASAFPKGTEVFRKMISDNFRMKKIKSQKNDFCEITFIVERDGAITNIKAEGNDESFNKEAVHAVSIIKENWIPAEVNGQKVRSRYRVPLNIDFN